MNIELNEEGYTTCGNWKLVPVIPTPEMMNVIDSSVIKYKNYSAILRESPKPEMQQKQKRIGDIHIGGEILPEFKDDWCRQCGCSVGHLSSCTMLAR